MDNLAISSVLGELVEQHVRLVTGEDKDCRLLVPGLTRKIAKGMHLYLRDNGVNSYLVVGPDEEEPSESDHFITAIGLTSKRIGSFVGIVNPGQLVLIQDSIRGSGGTIRSLAFHEEWPWIDNGSESLQFDGPVLGLLVKRWSRDHEKQDWLREFVLRLLEHTRSSSNRAHIFLEEILGSFSPDLYPDVRCTREKFLYHVGVPWPEGSLPPVNQLVRDTALLSKRIVGRCRKEENLRNQLMEGLVDLVEQSEQHEIETSLNHFLDGIGKSTTLDLGILAFYRCWGLADDGTRHWRKLGAKLLADIFDVRDSKKAHVDYKIDKNQHNIVASADNNKLATFFGENVLLSITYKIERGEFASGNWSLRVFNRQRVVWERELTDPEESIGLPVELNTADVANNYLRKIPLRIALVSGNDVEDQARLDMHLCGENRRAFTVVHPSFEVVDGTSPSEEDFDKKLTINEPAHLFLFSYEETDVSLRDEDDEDIDIVEHGTITGIWRSDQRVDASAEPSGLVTRKCKFGPLETILCFEANDLEKGEFTLEDELRKTICNGRKKRLEELTELFEKKRDEPPYIGLGQIDDAARRRISLAKIVTSRGGWRPLLVDILGKGYSPEHSLGKFINRVGPIEDDAFRTLVLPDEVCSLLEKYSDSRNAVREEVESSFSNSSTSTEHPMYASHPIFVHERSVRMESLLKNYLYAYQEILSYLQNNKKNLEWSQMFVLAHLDCVVHWDNGCSFFLVGPWHPLVLAKRFMVQAALFSRAYRFLHEGDGEHFRDLSLLLGNVQGFRWILGMSYSDTIVEPAYVMLTSDPGWHFAVATRALESGVSEGIDRLPEIAQKLQRSLGLSIASPSSGNNNLVVTCLSSYLRAFPSRRSIGIRIRQGYIGSDIVKNVDRNIHEEEGPTEQGQQLSGGVRLYFEESLDNEIDVRWTDPPIYIYQFEKDEEHLPEVHPDIYMVPPVKDFSLNRNLSSQVLPRGRAREAVFSKPLVRLTEGSARVPKSITYEYDGPRNDSGNVGSVFTKVTGEIASILGSPVATVCEVDLPQKLLAPWVVISGHSIDPAILVKYVKDGVDRKIEERALWDYKVDLTGQGSSYFVLSNIPSSFQIAVNGFFRQEDVANNFIVELGEIGIAIGGEALKSGRHALGVIGLIGAVRLLVGEASDGRSPISSSDRGIGFLIPVDSFSSFFGRSGSGDGKRTDLLAVQVVFPGSESGKLRISACGVESKFVSGTFGNTRAENALNQATETCREFKKLVLTSLSQGAMPERLALLDILTFGLRIASPSERKEIEKWAEREKDVYTEVLAGNYEYINMQYEGLLVSTEGELPGVAEYKPIGEGSWVRLTREHWPGISETAQIDSIRRSLCDLIGMTHENVPSTVILPPEVAAKTRRVESAEEDVEDIDLYKIPPRSRETRPELVLSDISPVGDPVDKEPKRERDGSRLGRIFIGVDDARNKMYFDPQSPVDPLDNMNVMVTGSSGTGKTQLLKHLICQLREQGKNVLVLDMKNDFASDKKFCEKASLERAFVSFDGLPLNPLIPYPVRHPETEKLFVQCGQYIRGVSSILRKTYGLGVQQQVAVKNAIVAAFTAAGIPTTGSTLFSEELRFPDFARVGDFLRHDNLAAYNRLDPLFTLDLFREEFQDRSFYNLVNRAVVLDMSQIPSDEIKNTLAQLVVLSAHAYYNSQPHSGTIRQFLVFDEGHRVLTSDYILRLVRECRAYGVGIILSSQYPSDFPGDISASMATKIVHGNGRDTNKVKDIVQLLGCEGREGEIANMMRFQALVDNSHYPHTSLRTMNYPLYLAWSKLQELGEATCDELSQAEGLDTSKLPIVNLVHQLELLGMAERRGNRVLLLRQT